MDIQRAACFLCWENCGILVKKDEDRILEVRGDPSCPINEGVVCERLHKMALNLHEHQRRLNYPLKRKGKRGSGEWIRISWQDAIEEIAGKLQDLAREYGVETLLCGGGTAHGSGADWCRLRFSNLFGSPNSFFEGINCGASFVMIQSAMFGFPAINLPEPGETRAMVLWGFNPAHSWRSAFRVFQAAKAKGAYMVVIDPRYTETASLADDWLKIRPGTDAALALGIINCLIREDSWDHEFVKKYVNGFEEVKVLALKYPPEKVAEITWIPEEKIEELARIYQNKKPLMQWAHLNGTHHGKASQAATQYVATLAAISGNLNKKGGTRVSGPVQRLRWYDLIGWDNLINHPLRKKDAVGAYATPKKGVEVMASFMDVTKKYFKEGHSLPGYWLSSPFKAYWDAILEEKPYPLKAAIFQGCNPFSSMPNNQHIAQALMSPKLELLVAMDLFPTPTTALCDYVLPATDFWERPELFNLWGILPTYHASRRTLPPLYERHDDYELWRDLGNLLGQKGQWPLTLEDMFTLQLEPWGIDFEEFARTINFYDPEQDQTLKKNTELYATTSGKIELAPPILEKLGLPSLPDYCEPNWSPISTPLLAEKYPLILITGCRTWAYQCGEHRDFAELRRFHPWPLVDIHPLTARKLDIAAGDWVYIETPLGRVKQVARLTTTIDPRVVHAEAYWWFPERKEAWPELYGVFESNINTILPDAYETLALPGGDNYLRALLCKVYPAAGAGSIIKRDRREKYGYGTAARKGLSNMQSMR